MAAYKDLVGQKITKVTSNPSEPKTGQMWYNSTNGKLRAIGVIEAWSSGSPRSTTAGGPAVFGQINTAAVACAGSNPPPTGLTATENYNGSGWTTSGASNTARYAAAAIGSQTAGLLFGGATPSASSASEEYDGSNWTSGNSLNTARSSIQGFGLQTAGVACGGTGPLGNNTTNATEEYDGTSWTAVTAMPLGNREFAASGIQTAGIATGGNSSNDATDDISVDYDGTNWTANSNLPVGASGFGGFGSADEAYVVGGGSTTMYEWNGTSWATPGANSANNAGSRIVANGTPSSSLFNGPSTTTEEYNRSTNAITAAAWASGGALNTAGRAGAAGSGTQTAAIIAGGGLGTVINNAESYNGSSWTNLPTIGTARGNMAGATNAPYTATLVFGGATGPGGPYVNNSEEYSGSSWAEGNNLNTARGYLAGFGIQTAAVAAGGTAPNPSPPSRQNAAEEYDGTNWTSVTNIPAAANSWGGCGTQTAGLVIGDVPMKGLLYDGTNWTTIPTLNVPGNYNKVFGTYSSAMTAGRNPSPAAGTAVEEWNGTTWFTQASLATGRFNGLGAGTTTAGLVAGAPTATEEFTGETETANIEDFTTS